MKKTKIEETVALDTLNKEVVKKLGKRVKKSKTSNAIEIDTQMTNHDKQLDESMNSDSLYYIANAIMNRFSGATLKRDDNKKTKCTAYSKNNKYMGKVSNIKLS